MNMSMKIKLPLRLVSLAAAGLFGAPSAWADAVTEWNARAGELIVAAGLGTPLANRVMAIT